MPQGYRLYIHSAPGLLFLGPRWGQNAALVILLVG
jgi:hypothetical protein